MRSEYMNFYVKKVGGRIKATRLERGMTQVQLAEKVGVTPRTVSSWETGVNFPNVDHRVTMSKVLGVEFHDLYSYTFVVVK